MSKKTKFDVHILEDETISTGRIWVPKVKVQNSDEISRNTGRANDFTPSQTDVSQSHYATLGHMTPVLEYDSCLWLLTQSTNKQWRLRDT